MIDKIQDRIKSEIEAVAAGNQTIDQAMQGLSGYGKALYDFGIITEEDRRIFWDKIKSKIEELRDE